VVPGGQAGGGVPGWKDIFLGIWVGGRGPIIGNPFLGLPTFTEALEQDRAQWQESQLAQFGDQYSFFQQGPTGGFVADWSVISRSPGGGGPGQSLTSTNPPSSVEEVGHMITSGGRSRKVNDFVRCPYYWTGTKWRRGMSPWLSGETANRCVKRASHGGRHRKD